MLNRVSEGGTEGRFIEDSLRNMEVQIQQDVSDIWKSTELLKV